MKSISAPFIPGNCTLTGDLSAPAWKKATAFDDFQLYMHEGTPVTARTEIRLFHNGHSLFVGMKCHEPTGVIHSGAVGFANLDRIEFFLGSMEPYPSCIQYAVAPGGMRYSGDGDADTWRSATAMQNDCWTAEAEIPFTKFHCFNMTCSFNICRYRVEAAEQQVWSEVGADFLSIARFGEICLDSYDAAARAKFNYYGNEQLDRQTYEKLCQTNTVPNHQLRYGPWLYDPTCDAMSVGWYNAGGSPAALEYRKKGEEQFKLAYSHYEAGVWDKARQLHKVRLTQLEPGSAYEYRVRNYLPDAQTFYCFPENALLSFTLPSPDAKECRFLIFTDIHGKKCNLEQFLKESKLLSKCDFIVNMGDMITNSNGCVPIFEGYLAGETFFTSRHPMFNLRGNHESRGILPTSYLELFGHEGGKSYFMYNVGKLCIIGVDGGEDYLCDFNMPYIQEQNQWLREIIKTEAFKNAEKRVLLTHMPLLQKQKYTPVVQMLLDGVFIGDKPLATIDVMLSGHTHRASYTEPNKDTYTCFYLDGEAQDECIPVPFPIVCNSGPSNREPSFTALYVEYANGKLKVDIVLPQNDKVLRSFSF